MRPIRSRAMAFEIAALLKRITGDVCSVFPVYGSRSDKVVGWRLMRRDFSGKEFPA